jgi:hypothetical protein
MVNDPSIKPEDALRLVLLYAYFIINNRKHCINEKVWVLIVISADFVMSPKRAMKYRHWQMLWPREASLQKSYKLLNCYASTRERNREVWTSSKTKRGLISLVVKSNVDSRSVLSPLPPSHFLFFLLFLFLIWVKFQIISYLLSSHITLFLFSFLFFVFCLGEL